MQLFVVFFRGKAYNIDMKTCYIIGAGDFVPPAFQKNPGDLTIAADGGYRYLSEYGIIPDLVVGDFDSLGYCPEATEICRLPLEKDLTDTAAAVEIGRERGYRRFVLYAVTGGRLDHTVANLTLLAQMAERGEDAMIVMPEGEIYALKDTTAEFERNDVHTVSVFAEGVAQGVTLKGLKYPLTDATLPRSPLGVSNEPTANRFSVTVKKGVLLVFLLRKQG